jgi:hypothetical protein
MKMESFQVALSATLFSLKTNPLLNLPVAALDKLQSGLSLPFQKYNMTDVKIKKFAP